MSNDLIVPFFKPSITDSEIHEVVDTLHSDWLTTGPKTKQFEEEFASYLNQKFAVSVNSCTAALHLALESIGVQRGDVVALPTMTFAATAEVVRYFDAKPLLIDCEKEHYNLDIINAEQQIDNAVKCGENVVAIIAVHYGGQICDMTGLCRLAKKYDLKIIEDAAHCTPAFYRENDSLPWKSVGADSEISCFSFYANKPITTGEGGMACTSNVMIADRMRLMSLHGLNRDPWKRFSSSGSSDYEIVAPGFKYNLTDIASAIGIHQLRRADWLHAKRKKYAELYSELLCGIEEIVLPSEQANRIHSWHLYAIRLRTDKLSISRNSVISELKKHNITTSLHWKPLHMHSYYCKTYGYAAEDYPVSAEVYAGLISLPLFPDMSVEQVKHVAESLKEIIRGNKL